MYAYLKLCLGVLLVAGASLQQQTNKPSESAAVAELSRLEKIWNEAYVHADADALESLCANDLVVTMSDMQVLNKNQSLAILRSGRVKFQSYETSDLGFRVYDSAAVVTGLLRRTRLAQGKESNDEWRFTKVYIRTAGKHLRAPLPHDHANDYATKSTEDKNRCIGFRDYRIRQTQQDPENKTLRPGRQW